MTKSREHQRRARCRPRAWALVASLLLPFPMAASDDGWELKRDRDGVQVYTRSVAGSKFKATRATATFAAPLAELVALIRDVGACADWAPYCVHAEVVEASSEIDLYVHTLNNMPWPLSDRDAIARVRWSQDPETLTVRMTASLIADRLPRQPGIVRLTYGETSWRFTPVDGGRVEVVSLGHVDPGGAVPAWLSNRLLVGAPYDTLIAMREAAASGRYAGARFEFMVEPGI